MNLNLKNIDWKRLVIGAVLGAVGGYAYYYFIGCQSGSCPLTSDPVKMTLYGIFFGIVLLYRTKKENTENHD
jgi:DMSO/TMAO reductase YedYZ heme-binding membrane subunit